MVSIIATLILGIAFAPTLVTAAWHLTHKKQIHAGGRTFLVPARWYPSIDYRTVTLAKFYPILRPEKPVSAVITLSPFLALPQTDAKRQSGCQSFASFFLAHMTNDAGATRGPIRAGTENLEACCMETAFKNKHNGISADCLAIGGSWTATFQGPPEELATFYKVITQLPSTK